MYIYIYIYILLFYSRSKKPCNSHNSRNDEILSFRDLPTSDVCVLKLLELNISYKYLYNAQTLTPLLFWSSAEEDAEFPCPWLIFVSNNVNQL